MPLLRGCNEKSAPPDRVADDALKALTEAPETASVRSSQQEVLL